MCSVASWSLLLGIEDTATAKLLVTAVRLESPGFAAEFDGKDLNTERGFSTCRSPIVHAAVTTLLAEMEQQQKLLDQTGWLTARQRAGEMVEHALDCLPSDGELWVRSAQLSQADADWSDTAASLGISQRLAPAEDAALRARLEIWAMVPAAIAERADTPLRSDIRVVLEHGRPELVRLLLALAPVWMLPAMRQEVEALSPRRRELATQLLPVLVDVIGSST